MRAKRSVRINGEPDVSISFGLLTRAVARGFHKAGWDVGFAHTAHHLPYQHFDPLLQQLSIPVNDKRRYDVELHILPILMGLRDGRNANRIAFSAWETTKVNAEWVRYYNTCKGLLVTSSWNAEVFKKSGVSVPVHAVGYGHDPLVFKPNLNGFPPHCIFGCMFRQARVAQNRKGYSRLIGAFLDAFQEMPNVVLQLKVHPDDALPDYHHPKIQVIRKVMSEADIVRWFHQLTAYVCPSRAEGWGIPVHLAMACGKPIIAPVYGGLLDFVDPDSVYPVKFHEVPVDGYIFDEGYWACWEESSMVERMLEVYEKPVDAFLRGLAGNQTIAKWTEDNMFEKVLKAVTRICRL